MGSARPFLHTVYSTVWRGRPATARPCLLVEALLAFVNPSPAVSKFVVLKTSGLPDSQRQHHGHTPSKVFQVVSACPPQARALYDLHVSCIKREQQKDSSV